MQTQKDHSADRKDEFKSSPPEKQKRNWTVVVRPVYQHSDHIPTETGHDEVSCVLADNTGQAVTDAGLLRRLGRSNVHSDPISASSPGCVSLSHYLLLPIFICQ